MVPRQSALFVAQKLLAQGLRPDEVLKALSAQGFGDVEARVAVSAASGQQGEAMERRWADADARQDDGRLGYSRAGVAAVLLGSGVLLVLLFGGWLGPVMAGGGLALMFVALYLLLRSEGW